MGKKKQPAPAKVKEEPVDPSEGSWQQRCYRALTATERAVVDIREAARENWRYGDPMVAQTRLIEAGNRLVDVIRFCNPDIQVAVPPQAWTVQTAVWRVAAKQPKAWTKKAKK